MITIKSFVPEFIKLPLRRYLHSKSFHRSQAGQDLWVIGEVFNEKKKGFFLDIGAHDGVYLSNTYILERKYQWDGICIEANPKTFSELVQNRHSRCVNACLDSTEKRIGFIQDGVFGRIAEPHSEVPAGASLIEMTTRPLIDILNEFNCPDEIDYVSCDIEGSEENVFLNFPFEEYRFNSLTIERPTERLKSILKENNYIEVKSIPGLDCFYIHSEFESKYLSNVFKYFEKKKLLFSLN